MVDLRSVEWGKFVLKDLFVAENGDFDIQQKHINGKGVDVVTAGETNNGIMGKTDVEAKIFDGNTITIDMFGRCVYRINRYKMVTHARVFSLKCTYEYFSKNIGLFMVASIQKNIKWFSFSRLCSWKKIQDISIPLPITPDGTPDWQFMEDYITELEQERITELVQERITELEHYLIASGLNDYELTEDDKEILATKLIDGGAICKSDISKWLLERSKGI